MNKQIQELYQCRECEFQYVEKEWAEKCRMWCQEHKSCNLEITAHAILPKEFYELKKRQKEEAKKLGQRKEVLGEVPKKIGRHLLFGLLSILIIVGVSWFILTRPNLPPTAMQGHIEESPPAHIITEPIPGNIQRHMFEHADGTGKPGIIIQYNCQKYTCELDLVEKLVALVKQYPDNVYLAPNNYDGKIILTREGKLEILDRFDEQKIKDFIGL